MAANGNSLELITSILSENPLIHRPDIIFGKLSDGLDYCIFNSESQKSSFHMSFVLNAGSIHEEESEKGVANFVHQIILTELNKELLKVRTEHATNITSSTDFHCTIFNIYNEIENSKLSESELRATFFNALEISLLTIYKFQEKLISSPNLFKEKIEEIRGKTFEIIDESNISVANNIEKQIFLQYHKDTLLPKRWPIGEKSSIENITVSNLIEFIKKWYIPNNMCLFIVGDIPASNELLVTHLSSFVAEMNYSIKDNRVSGLKNIYETSSFHNIFSVKDRIGHRTIQNSLSNINEPVSSDSKREVIVEHSSIDQVSITIGIKLEICPLIDEGEIFMNAVDTIISNAIHAKLLSALSQLECEESTSISWDFYNSSRENCGWNTFSIVTDDKDWKTVFRLSIKQIMLICSKKLPMEEFEEIVLTTISDYKKSAEEELEDDPKLVLDGLIDDWLCGSIPLSKKQEYQLFCKVVDRINPEIIHYRCKTLFGHILNYFNKNQLCNKGFSTKGCIFISKPLNSNKSSELDQENLINASNSKLKIQETSSEFINSLLEEYKSCLKVDLEPDIDSTKICSSDQLSFERNAKIERISESHEFGIWDLLKATTYISIDKIFDSLRTNFGLLIGELIHSNESIEDLNGEYSIKELDLLAERIKSNLNVQSYSSRQKELDLPNDICDLGS